MAQQGLNGPPCCAVLRPSEPTRKLRAAPHSASQLAPQLQPAGATPVRWSARGDRRPISPPQLNLTANLADWCRRGSKDGNRRQQPGGTGKEAGLCSGRRGGRSVRLAHAASAHARLLCRIGACCAAGLVQQDVTFFPALSHTYRATQWRRPVLHVSSANKNATGSDPQAWHAPGACPASPSGSRSRCGRRCRRRAAWPRPAPSTEVRGRRPCSPATMWLRLAAFPASF